MGRKESRRLCEIGPEMDDIKVLSNTSHYRADTEVCNEPERTPGYDR
jgi:hypothetical protein